jgi:hypothetical protein
MIKEKKYFKSFIIVIMAALFSMTFTSCSVFDAIGDFFWGLIKGIFWIAATLATLTLWIAYIVYDRTGKKEKRRRFDKGVSLGERDTIEFFDLLATGAIWISLFSLFGFLFSFSMLFKGLPRWLLVIVTLVQCGVIIGKWKNLKTKSFYPFYIWLSSTFIFMAVFHIFGLTEFTITFDNLAFIPEFIRNIFSISADMPFEFTTNFLIALVASGLLALIPANIVNIPLKAQARKKAEVRRQKEEEEERKHREQEQKQHEKEERFRNLPPGEKIAVIDSEEQEKFKEIRKTLTAAKKEYNKHRAENQNKSPEEYMHDYINGSLTAQAIEISKITGMHKAASGAMALSWVASYFAAGYRAAVCEAILEDAKYTANRRKAEVYAGNLKEIYEKLTAKQKKRQITSAAETLKIGSVNIKMPDTVSGIEKLSVKLSDGRTEKLFSAIGSYSSFRKNVDFGNEAVNLGSFLAGVAVKSIADKINDELAIREKARKSEKTLMNKIFKIQKDEPKVKAFTARARELNTGLKKAMEAYAKMFDDVYTILYPADDASKSKEEREKRKKSGGSYFNEEESEAVMQLYTAGKFLLLLVDTKFEGEYDGE